MTEQRPNIFLIISKVDARHENAYWPEWLALARQDARASSRVGRYLQRPQAELDDLRLDPGALDNRVRDRGLARA